jgi:hypothetical protein
MRNLERILATVIAIRPWAEKQSHINISHRFAPIYTDKQEEKWLMVNRKAIN